MHAQTPIISQQQFRNIYLRNARKIDEQLHPSTGTISRRGEEANRSSDRGQCDAVHSDTDQPRCDENGKCQRHQETVHCVHPKSDERCKLAANDYADQKGIQTRKKYTAHVGLSGRHSGPRIVKMFMFWCVLPAQSAAQHADQSKNVVQPQPRPGAPTPTKAPAAKPTPSQRPLAPDEFEIPIIDQDHRKSWRFPKTKSCPASQCGEKFVSRDQAIDHFRSVHLESAMWCADCPKLLQTPNPFKSITLHYGTMHPTVQLSPNWKQTVVSLGACS